MDSIDPGCGRTGSEMLACIAGQGQRPPNKAKDSPTCDEQSDASLATCAELSPTGHSLVRRATACSGVSAGHPVR